MEMTSNYCKNFNSEWFMDVYHGPVDDKNSKIGVTRYFVLNSFHRYFTSDTDFGTCLLDIGTGPEIWSILSASRRMERIVLSDYMPRNLQMLKDWKDGRRCETNTDIHIEMELAGQNQPISEREATIRSKITGIHHIDVTMERVFDDPNMDDMMFDVITSSFCFEAASKDREEYSRSIKNVSKMLKPEGYLIIVGGVEESYYVVDKFRFPVLALKTEEIRSIYEANGFEILGMDTLYEGHFPDEEEKTISDIKNVFALFAEKTSS